MTHWLVRWRPWGGNTAGRRFWNANEALTLNRAARLKLSFCLQVRCSPSFLSLLSLPPFLLPPLPSIPSPLVLPPSWPLGYRRWREHLKKKRQIKAKVEEGGEGKWGGAVLTPAFCPDEGAEERNRQARGWRRLKDEGTWRAEGGRSECIHSLGWPHTTCLLLSVWLPHTEDGE